MYLSCSFYYKWVLPQVTHLRTANCLILQVHTIRLKSVKNSAFRVSSLKSGDGNDRIYVPAISFR